MGQGSGLVVPGAAHTRQDTRSCRLHSSTPIFLPPSFLFGWWCPLLPGQDSSLHAAQPVGGPAPFAVGRPWCAAPCRLRALKEKLCQGPREEWGIGPTPLSLSCSPAPLAPAVAMHVGLSPKPLTGENSKNSHSLRLWGWGRRSPLLAPSTPFRGVLQRGTESPSPHMDTGSPLCMGGKGPTVPGMSSSEASFLCPGVSAVSLH